MSVTMLTFHASDLESLIRKLEHDSMLATEWFESNYMKLNGDKFDLLLSGYKHEVMWTNIGQSQIWESKEQKLLGVINDRDMKFEYILIQCKKAGRKLCALGRVCTFLNLECRRSLMEAFIEPNLHTAFLYECSIAEVQIITLIICMNEH